MIASASDGPRYPQSGVLVLRGREEDLELLLIRNLKDTRWVIPKGLVEPDLTPWDSAAKEAWEEAGVTGEVDEESLGSFEYRKWGGVCEVEVFAMRAVELADDYPEAGARRRRWMTPTEATEAVREPELKEIMARLPASLAKTDASS